MPDFLDLYDYRRRVAAMYRKRAEALQSGEDAALVLQRFRETRDVLFATLHFDVERHPRKLLAGGNENLFRTKLSQKLDLPLPKRLAAKNNLRLVPAHPPRLAASEQDRGKSHGAMLSLGRLAASAFRAMILP